MQITEGISRIRELWERRAEIKRTMAELRQEDAELVDKLNEMLGVNLQDTRIQTFEIGTLTLKVTPKISRTVKTAAALKLMGENEEAKAHSDVFRTKLEINTGAWNALSADEQALFAEVVTERPGKAEYEEVVTGEEK